MFASKNPRFLAALISMGLLSSFAVADSLELKNGSMIKGKYLGGSETEISFRVGSTVQRYSVNDVVSLTFDRPHHEANYDDSRDNDHARDRDQDRDSDSDHDRSANDDTSRAPHLAERPAAETVTGPSTTSVTIDVPSGTRLMVRTVDSVDSDRNQVGDKFKATLEQPLVVNGVTVVPKGADVYGKLMKATEAGRIQGRSELKLELTGIVVDGQTVPVSTGDYSVAGNSRGATSAKRIGGGAAVGSIIGAIAGGGKGAAIGAGVGAGAGTAVQVMTKGEQVHVPSETLLEFTLQQNVTMPVEGGSGTTVGR